MLEAVSRLRIISKDDDSTCWPASFSAVLQDIHLVFFAVSKYCYIDHIYFCVKLLRLLDQKQTLEVKPVAKRSK